MTERLPYRREPDGESGPRPALPLPPARMPPMRGGRPLKRWRYVGAFCEEAMVCAAIVRIGPARQVFWAVWDRDGRRLYERTRVVGRSGVRLAPRHLAIRDGDVRVELELEEDEGVETVCPHGRGYVWTRKQGGIGATGTLALEGAPERELHARAVIDDTAGYHARTTEWWWAAGVGARVDGQPVAWNLVAGVNDPAQHSERTVWVAGRPAEVERVTFSPQLDTIESGRGALSFTAEAERRRRERLLLISSDYRQPFGTFTGVLPDGTALAHGLGVTEHHLARW